MKIKPAIKTLKIHLNEILAGLIKSPFVKNLLVVMSGTVAGQIIGFLLIPVVSRLYSPSDFGIFGSFDAIMMVIIAGVTLDYTQALMLPKENNDAINLFVLSCISAVLISILCLAVCLFAPVFILGLMKTRNAWILVLLVMYALVIGLNQACQAWCIRVKAFKQTSASQVIRSLSLKGTQIVFGCFRGGAAGLIVGNVLADILASLNLIRVVIPDVLIFRNRIRWDRIKQLAKDYRDFPMYSASQGVINALSSGLPVLLLSHFYGLAIAGAYAFGMIILQAPTGFLLRALRQVLFQKASETHNYGDRLTPIFMKTTLALFALAFLPALILFLWGPQLFTWIFGYEWRTAGELARRLTPLMIFISCSLPAVIFAKIVRMQRFVFFYDLCLLAARVLALVFGGMYLGFLPTVMLFALVSAAMSAVLIFRVGYVVMKNEGR